MRVTIERTDVTSAGGRPSVFSSAERFNVEAASLSNALVVFLEQRDGRILGTVTENENRAVCTAWLDERVVLLIAEPQR